MIGVGKFIQPTQLSLSLGALSSFEIGGHTVRDTPAEKLALQLAPSLTFERLRSCKVAPDGKPQFLHLSKLKLKVSQGDYTK